MSYYSSHWILLFIIVIVAYFSRSVMMKTFSRTFMGAKQATLLRKVVLIEQSEDHLPVYTLTFSNPPGMSSLGVRIDYADVIKVVVPNYKPKSYSMSDERPGEFDITVKVYPNGRASGYLDRIPIGGSIDVFRKGSNERFPGKYVGILAFGVGITEALPVAAAELSKPDAKSVHLIWTSRTKADTFWDDKVADLKARYPDKFALTYVFSREAVEGCIHGRLNSSILRSLTTARWEMDAEFKPKDVRFVTVGTKEMMYEADKMITDIGYPMPNHALFNHGSGRGGGL